MTSAMRGSAWAEERVAARRQRLAATAKILPIMMSSYPEAPLNVRVRRMQVELRPGLGVVHGGAGICALDHHTSLCGGPHGAQPGVRSAPQHEPRSLPVD